MKNKLLKKLLWPNLWVGILSVLAALGIILMVAGHFTGASAVAQIGFWFVVPLIAGGILLVAFVFPYLIILNRRAKNRQESAREHNQ